jgi:cation:H+ antiporter
MAPYDIVVFAVAVGALWKASSVVVSGVDGFSRDARVSSFAASFLILGILTSLTEISVGINSLAEAEPQIFAGNLIGGSFVILLFIIPLLAIANKGVTLKGRLDPKRTAYFLMLLAMPCVTLLDGVASRTDAGMLIGLYAVFVNSLRKASVPESASETALPKRAVGRDVGRILLGAAVIYLSSAVLVHETSLLAHAMGIPSILVSLLVLSIGTNLPELSLAASSVKKGRPDIAFGDYVGSAAFNVFLFGIFTLIHGPFSVAFSTILPITLVIALGYCAFFFAAKSNGRISPSEAVGLICIYILFLALQVATIISLS